MRRKSGRLLTMVPVSHLSLLWPEVMQSLIYEVGQILLASVSHDRGCPWSRGREFCRTKESLPGAV